MGYKNGSVSGEGDDLHHTLLRHARIKGRQQDLGPFPRMQVKRHRGIFRSSELLLRRVHIGTMTK